MQEVKTISVYEVAKRRGHDYLTVVSEPGEGKTRRSRVLYVTEGKDAATVGRAQEWLASRGVSPEQITTVCADMSPAYAKGVGEHFPEAELVFDYFHVVSGVSSAVDAVDAVRVAELSRVAQGHALALAQKRGQTHRRTKVTPAAAVSGQAAKGPGAWAPGAPARSDETKAGGGRAGFALVVRVGGPLAHPRDDEGRPDGQEPLGWHRGVSAHGGDQLCG